MPYKSNRSIPPAAKKALTTHGKTVWRKAYNAAARQYPAEGTAFKVAWTAAHKAGGKKK